MPLPVEFYARDALDVAQDLIGCTIRSKVDGAVVQVMITEVEAYRFPGDTANHARAGRTARNAPMWGPPGRSYVYLCYGLHHMLNLVTGPEGEPAAVLIRAAAPVDGLDVIRARRGRVPDGPTLLDGPGKVGQALGLTTAWSGCTLDGALRVDARSTRPALLAGPRIGIGYASAADQAAPWRLALAGSTWVGHRAGLAPLAPAAASARVGP